MRSVCTTIIACSLLAASGGIAGAQSYIYPDAELMNTEFHAQIWGSGTLDSNQDLPGQGVRLWITLGKAVDGGKTVIGDDWAVASTAGLAWDGGYYPNDPGDPHALPHDNVSIAAWDGIEMMVRYVSGPADIEMKLFMNTGMTGPSGYPSDDGRNNTAWTGQSQALSVGGIATLELDFDNAQTWGAADNPYPHSGSGAGWADGTWRAINQRDRREVTNMGFEVYGAGYEQQIVLDVSIPEPATAGLLIAGGIAALLRRKKR